MSDTNQNPSRDPNQPADPNQRQRSDRSLSTTGPHRSLN